MSTSAVYDSIRAALQQHLPTVIASQIDSLGLAIVGAVQSMSSQMAKIARAMPLDTTELAKEQRLRRLLDNARLTQADHYQPIVQHALHGLAHQRVQLLIDRVLLRDQHNIAGRECRLPPPLDPAGLARLGASRVEQPDGPAGTDPNGGDALAQLACGSACMAIASFARASCLSGCVGRAMTRCWGFAGEMWVYDTADPRADGQPLAARVEALPPQTATGRKRKHRTSPITYLAQVYVGQEQRSGPVNLHWLVGARR